MATKKAIRLNPKLWEAAKKEVMKDGKIWSARKAQLAVKIYKQKGGKYSKQVKREDTALHKWTKEDWGYIGPKSKRYLPKKVRDALSPAEKKRETKAKKSLGSRYSYSASVNRKMKKKKIY